MSDQIQREQKIAQLLVKRHSLSPPVDVLSLLKNYADYQEDILPISGVDGISIMGSSKPLVIVNKTHSSNRKRFTQAHELGHLVIPWHYGMISCRTDREDNVDDSLYYEMESQANNFAAEILMPSLWLDRLVAVHEDKGLENLVGIIAEQAEVSKAAAFFSVFKHLPSGYFLLVKNNEKGYIRRMASPGTDLFLPQSKDVIGWLDSIAIKDDSFSADPLTVYCWKIETSFTKESVTELVTEIDSFAFDLILDKLISHDKGAMATYLITLVSLLPPGFILCVRGQFSDKLLASPDTKIRVPRTSKGRYDFDRLSKYSSENGSKLFGGFTISWWRFITKLPKTNVINDKRPSKDILKGILGDCFPGSEERDHYTRKINGTFGALNNFHPKDFDDFYRMVKERFTGVDEYRVILNHQDFDAFVVKKITEILSKKK